MTQRIVDMTVTELSEKLRSRKLSAEEAAKAYLGQMEKREPEVGAYLTVTREAALETARKVDQKRMKGEELHPLAGIPTGIKDNICTKGVKTTCASRMLENFVPPYDAAVIERLKDCHIVMLGKLNMDEFAMGSTTENSYYQITKIPGIDRCRGEAPAARRPASPRRRRPAPSVRIPAARSASRRPSAAWWA